MMLHALPHAFVLGSTDGTFEMLSERISRIPAKATRTFHTVEDGHSAGSPWTCMRGLDVYEGETVTVDGNRKLGSFDVFIPRWGHGAAGTANLSEARDDRTAIARADV